MSFVAAPPTARTRNYALGLLVVVYTSNFIDRQLIGIVSEPMKAELGLADWQIGLLGGLAFALFYTILGIPIARLAERRNRVNIIAVALVTWSAMTALCGAARTFPQLLLARVGVGVGEAGCSPAAQSLIADYFPPERRATALSIYSLGIPLGSLFGALAGGWLAEAFGWRMVFVLLGLPGIALALLVRLTMREPVRGLFDGVTKAEPAPFGEVLRTLARDRVFLHMAAGATICSFVGYGKSTFAVPLLMRGYGLELGQAATAYALFAASAAAIGTGLGGWLADRGARSGAAWRGRVPAIGCLLGGPIILLALWQDSLAAVGLLAFPGLIGAYLYLGPTFAATNNAVAPRMRATAVAILYFALNLIGLGLGPLVTGLISDLAAEGLYAGAPTASYDGLRLAMSAVALLYLWAAFHFFRAGRAMARAAD